MARSIRKKSDRTPEEQARLAAIREQVERERQTGTEPGSSPAYDGPFKQGYGVATGRLAARLRSLREKAGLSLSDLEERTGIDRATLSKLEGGHTPNPTLYTLWRYALGLGSWGDFVGLDLADLFRETLQAVRDAEAEALAAKVAEGQPASTSP